MILGGLAEQDEQELAWMMTQPQDAQVQQAQQLAQRTQQLGQQEREQGGEFRGFAAFS